MKLLFLTSSIFAILISLKAQVADTNSYSTYKKPENERHCIEMYTSRNLNEIATNDLVYLNNFHNYHSNLNDSKLTDSRELSRAEIDANPNFQTALRARPFRLKNSFYEANDLRVKEILLLDLFEDKTYFAKVEKISTNINNTLSIRAKLVDFDFAYCFITITGDKALINIEIPELQEYYITSPHPITKESFLLLFDQDNLDYIENDKTLLINEFDNHLDPNEATEYNNLENRHNWNINSYFKKNHELLNQLTNEEVEIDIMIVYTPAALDWTENHSFGILNTIANAMARANLVAENSEVGILFNLVYSGLVDYTEVNPPSPATDFQRLFNPNDGFMDEIHNLRNEYAADLVSLFTKTNEVGGYGNLLTNRYGNHISSCSLIRVQQAASSYTFIHELGHNLGAHHHKLQNFQQGPTNWFNWAENQWSAGWRWVGNDGKRYCTVMTYTHGNYYEDGKAHSRCPYFSNPKIFFKGNYAGHAVNGDNARSIRKVKHFISKYRDAKTLAYCTAWGRIKHYHISYVELGGIQQLSSGNGYADFSFNSTEVMLGSSDTMTVLITNPHDLGQLLVWVDWNDDNMFNEYSEIVFKSDTGPEAEYRFIIYVPEGVELGEKRLRIRYNVNNVAGNSTPCGESFWGDVEDYTLVVVNKTHITDNRNVFSISPIPASDYLDIKLTEEFIHSVGLEIRIVNLLGKLVLDSPTPTITQNGVIKINVQHLPAGMYFLKLYTMSGEVLVEKVIVGF